jgi:hypothetical protein
MKYTPGPWTVNDVSLSEDGASAYQIQNELCGLPYEATFGDVDERFRANLNLIEAAPDLLEALEICATAEMYRPEEYKKAMLAANAAIAKAKGNK